MTELTRRGLLITTGALTTAAIAAEPAFAQNATSGAGTAPQPAPEPPAWDLTDLYPTDAAWEAERQRITAALPGLAAKKGTLGTSAASLEATLKQVSDLRRALGRLGTYAELKADADLRVAPNQEKRQLAEDLGSQFGEATAWMQPELLAVGKAKLEGFLAADPGLKNFHFFIEDVLRQAPHTLSSEAEGVLAAAGSPINASRAIYGQITASDMPHPVVTLSTGKKVTLDAQGYTLAREALNRADRKLVFEQFFGSYGNFRNSLGATYSASVKGDIFDARQRRYKSSIEAALSGTNLPEAVYRTLIAETNRGLPVLHRYFRFRQKMLKLPDLHYYDIYPPIVTLDRTFTVPQMRQLTLDAVAPLGPVYVDTLAKSTAAKWMDPLPRPGKYAGAYMNPGAFDVHPYLLLNLAENYEGATTFAHEWGHAMHTLIANHHQPFEVADYPIFLAEIASTCNEQLLADHMFATAKTKQEKLFYLGQKMESFRGTFFRQAMFAEFEAQAHDAAERGEGISGEKFAAIYLDLLKRYHGDSVIIADVVANEWSYIPHFYNAFYVFQYATSIAAATHFEKAILKDGAPARDRYMGVLASGGSDYGYDTLKKAGLDMAGPEPYRDLVAEFSRVLDVAETLI